MSKAVEQLRYLYVWGLDAVDELRAHHDDDFSLGYAAGSDQLLQAIAVILKDADND